jgi:hypothetical protein
MENIKSYVQENKDRQRINRIENACMVAYNKFEKQDVIS